MKRHTLSITFVTLTLAVTSATAQTLVLDDFTSGSDDIVTKTTPSPSCKPLSATTPLGSTRSTTLTVALNPFTLLAETSIGNGHLIMDLGLNMYNRIDLVYGLDCPNGDPSPMALDLSAYNRFRINFLGITGNSALNFNIVVYQHDGQIYSAGQNFGPQTGPFSVDFPFS